MSHAGVSGPLEVNIEHKSYRAASGGRLHVLGEVSFALMNGEVAALVGPSGCGKTTLLRIVTGLDRDFEGSVRLPAHGGSVSFFRSRACCLGAPSKKT